MKRKTAFLLTFLFSFSALALNAADSRKVLRDFLNRIGGEGTAERFVLKVDTALRTDGKDCFFLGAEQGKPSITGSSVLAATTGVNYYLNHVAHIQLGWQQLRADLANAPLPLPAAADTRRHTCTADYRYYLNYCTFSYSMAFWTWERWEQEIDWMALHGINMPLAIVGLETVWRNVLLRCGKSEADVARFVAGPAYQAWFLMGNLEGWGGPNPEWWYARQERLGRQIVERERSFGMTPVLPGYSGMAPSQSAADAGRWHGFTRPALLNPASQQFADMAKVYYDELQRVLGTSPYYSIDLFHEGAPKGYADLRPVFRSVFNAMDRAVPGSRWVIQGWGSNPLKECLEAVPQGRLLVLDLFADGNPRWQSGFGGHDFIFCILPNFGGRSGVHGRLRQTMTGYHDALSKYPATCRGVGAAPEGIGDDGVLYDALYEIPWTGETQPAAWICRYATARYGQQIAACDTAWTLLQRSVYDCETKQQGCSEPVVCARPSFTADRVSSWSTVKTYYFPGHVRRAAALLLSQRGKLSSNRNYQYDVVNFVRQALCDEALRLLSMLDETSRNGAGTDFISTAQQFTELIADIDNLCSSHPDFMLGTWTAAACNLANEPECPTAGSPDPAAADFFEQQARMLITTWGAEAAANKGKLHDYSNRCWAGLLRTFYLPRWKRYIDDVAQHRKTPTPHEWYEMEHQWVTDTQRRFPVRPSGNPVNTARQIFSKHFGGI